MGCACHPWRDCIDFDWPQSRHPVEPFGPQEALLLVGCADRASPIHGGTVLASTGPSLASPATEHSSVSLGTAHEATLRKRLPSPLASRSALKKRCFLSAAPTGCVHPDWMCMPSLAGLYWLRLAPALPSMASRSALKKRCFLSAAPTGPHPVNLGLRFSVNAVTPSRKSARDAQSAKYSASACNWASNSLSSER